MYFVALAPLAEPGQVLPAIAAALGVPQTPGRSLVESLGTSLGSRDTLLVLDNFEHVRQAATDVAALLTAAPRLRVVVTTRVPVRIAGEHELSVPPLPMPEPAMPLDVFLESPAIRLFADRAGDARSDFSVGAANAAAVGALCARLDGLPLAIELAAARVRLMSPEAMLARIGERLDLLTSRTADADARHRTLRASIAWSHDLLSDDERAVFRRLAVFRGGCTIEAAEAICGRAVLDELTALVEHNLVGIRYAADGTTRLEMLETILEFAREQLEMSGEREKTARRHADFYAGWAEEVEPYLYSDARAPWLLRLADERDNIRAALAWAEAQDESQLGLRILASLWLMYWVWFNEGLEWAARLLALPSAGEPTPVRAGALFTAELCAAGAGDVPALLRYGEEAVAVARACEDDRTLALALVVRSHATAMDDADQVVANLDEALAVAERAGDEWVHAWMNLVGGLLCVLIGRPDEAKARAEQAVRRFEELGDSWSRASSALSLGSALLFLGDIDGARVALDGAVPALLAVGDLKMANGCVLALATAERFAGNNEAAGQLYADALALCVEAGDPANASACLEGAAAVSAARDPRRAARLLGAAQGLVERGRHPSVPFYGVFYESTLATLREVLGDELEPLLAAGSADAARGDALAPAYAAAP